MQSVFFYGSLRDRELLEVVVGRHIDDADLISAKVAGYRAMRLVGEDYPVLVSDDGGRAEGVVLRNISEQDHARLLFFEEAEYGVEPIEVLTVQGPVATVYFKGTPKTNPSDAAWDFHVWQTHHRIAALFAARELMALYGVLPVEEIDTVWFSILRRANQRARAVAEVPPNPSLRSGFGRDDVGWLGSERLHTGFATLDQHHLRHRRHSGGWTPELARMTVGWGDAATVLPYDPVRDEVLLIEQFRSGPAMRGDVCPWCIEVIAGLIDGSESPEDTVRREAREEAGVEIRRLQKIAGFYATPGIVSEHHTSYIGEADLSAAGGVFGLESEGEDIRSFVVRFSEAMSALDAGDVTAGPALIALLWLARQRDTLRSRWCG